jgi:hypothetical protein
MLSDSKGVILRSKATKNPVFSKQGTCHVKNETFRLRLRVTVVGG